MKTKFFLILFFWSWVAVSAISIVATTEIHGIADRLESVQVRRDLD